jgi:hypothetical protein
LKTVTNLGYLLRLASELEKAKLSKDQEKIAEAQKAHDAYAALCLASNEVRY